MSDRPRLGFSPEPSIVDRPSVVDRPSIVDRSSVVDRPSAGRPAAAARPAESASVPRDTPGAARRTGDGVSPPSLQMTPELRARIDDRASQAHAGGGIGGVERRTVATATPERRPGTADPGKAPLLNGFLPPTGAETAAPLAVNAREHPVAQDDNHGRNPGADARAVARGATELPHRSAEDMTELGRLVDAFDPQTGTARPPSELLYQGGRWDEATVDSWKDQLQRGETPELHMDMRSTSTDDTALFYRDPPRENPGGVPEGSQGLGKPPEEGDGIAATTHLPGEDPKARRVGENENVPGHEVLIHAQDLDQAVAAEIAKGGPERAAHMVRLREALEAGAMLPDGTRLPSILVDGRIPAVPYTEHARLDDMNESILSGDYEMVRLVDTRPGQEFAWSATGVPDLFAVPGKGGAFSEPPPGVYATWRPRT